MSTFFKVTNLLFKKASEHFNLKKAKRCYLEYKKSESNHITNRKFMLFQINALIEDIKNNDISSLTIKNTIEDLFANEKIEKLFREKLRTVLLEKPQDEHIEASLKFLEPPQKNTRIKMNR